MVLAWFVLLRLPLPLMTNVYLPTDPLQALFVIVAYMDFWVGGGAALVYATTALASGWVPLRNSHSRSTCSIPTTSCRLVRSVYGIVSRSH